MIFRRREIAALVLGAAAGLMAAPPSTAQTGPLDRRARDALPDEAFAFPAQRKAPIEDAGHVRAAIARFRQVKGVTDAERDAAWARIRAAARRFHLPLRTEDWREIGAGDR